MSTLHFISLCWRDLWRNRRRTILTGLVMTFAVTIMILFIGMGDGAHTQMIRSATDSFLGQIQIQEKGYMDEPDLLHRLEIDQLVKVYELLGRAEGVTGWAPRVATGGLLSKKVPDPLDEDDLDAYRDMTSEGAFVVGVDPAMERTVSVLQESLVADAPQDRCLRGCRMALGEIYAAADDCAEICSDSKSGFAGETCLALAKHTCKGRCDPEDDLCYEEDCEERFGDYCDPATFLGDSDPFSDQPYLGQMVLGSGLARVLDVGVGDRVALTSGTSQGRPFASLYRVAGLVKTGSLDINRTFALTHHTKLAKGLEMPGAASFVVVSVDDLDGTEGIAAGVKELVAEADPNLVALGWMELSPELEVFIKIDQGSLLVTLVFLVMIVGVILANVVTMSVMERTREYGVRLALGEPPNRITLGLITETMLLALLASALGCLIGEAANYYFQLNGFDLGMGEIESTGVLISTYYYTEVTLYGLVFSVCTVLVLALAGAVYPAWRIRRLKPVEAWRFV